MIIPIFLSLLFLFKRLPEKLDCCSIRPLNPLNWGTLKQELPPESLKNGRFRGSVTNFEAAQTSSKTHLIFVHTQISDRFGSIP
jgi:hypothetical protein